MFINLKNSYLLFFRFFIKPFEIVEKITYNV